MEGQNVLRLDDVHKMQHVLVLYFWLCFLAFWFFWLSISVEPTRERSKLIMLLAEEGESQQKDVWWGVAITCKTK